MPTFLVTITGTDDATSEQLAEDIADLLYHEPVIVHVDRFDIEAPEPGGHRLVIVADVTNIDPTREDPRETAENAIDDRYMGLAGTPVSVIAAEWMES